MGANRSKESDMALAGLTIHVALSIWLALSYRGTPDSIYGAIAYQPKVP